MFLVEMTRWIGKVMWLLVWNCFTPKKVTTSLKSVQMWDRLPFVSVRNTPELKNFDQDALMQVLGAATFINAAPGHILCHQGEVGDRFFAIIEGMVSIHVKPKVEVESALATAAESKGSGSQLIKTMLAALSQHKAEAGGMG